MKLAIYLHRKCTSRVSLSRHLFNTIEVRGRPAVEAREKVPCYVVAAPAKMYMFTRIYRGARK
jgi:hypothetical protein